MIAVQVTNFESIRQITDGRHENFLFQFLSPRGPKRAEKISAQPEEKEISRL